MFQLIHGEWNEEPQPAWVIALDKTTGKEIWKHYRKSDAFAENVHSYASPILYEDDQQQFLLSHGADYIIAHDLETGNELWRCGGLNPKDSYNKFLRLVRVSRNGTRHHCCPFGKERPGPRSQAGR